MTVSFFCFQEPQGERLRGAQQPEGKAVHRGAEESPGGQQRPPSWIQVIHSQARKLYKHHNYAFTCGKNAQTVLINSMLMHAKNMLFPITPQSHVIILHVKDNCRRWNIIYSHFLNFHAVLTTLHSNCVNTKLIV